MTSLNSTTTTTTSDQEDENNNNNTFAKHDNIDKLDECKQTFESAFGFVAEGASLNNRRKQQNPRRQNRNDTSESGDSSSWAEQQEQEREQEPEKGEFRFHDFTIERRLYARDCAISAHL